MICKSLDQAQEIARKNAARMAAEGYAAERSPMNPWVFKVLRPAEKGGGFYRVQFGPRMTPDCPCQFFRGNARRGYKTCKHIEFAQAEAEALDWCAARGIDPQTFATAPNSLDSLTDFAGLPGAQGRNVQPR